MAGNVVKISFLRSALCGHKPVNLYRAQGGGFSAIVFGCGMNEDVDGAVTCYGPANKHPIEYIGNATNEDKPSFNPQGHNSWLWVGLISRRKDQVGPLRKYPQEKVEDILDTSPHLEDFQHRFPVKQRASDPAPGFYVSSTAAVRDDSRPEWDPLRFWDASSVNYMALTPALADYGVNYGDYGIAIRNGLYGGFFFADWGNKPKVAECSRSLFRYLFPLYPKESNEHGASYMVFPGTGGAVRTKEHPFGTTSWDAPLRIHTTLRQQIMSLSAVENRDELPLFFTLGADPGRLKHVLRSLKEPEASYTSNDYKLLVSMLTLIGYQADLPAEFHASDSSPNR